MHVEPMRHTHVRPVVDSYKLAFPNSYTTRLGDRFLNQLVMLFVDDVKTCSYVARSAQGEVTGFILATADSFPAIRLRQYLGLSVALALCALCSFSLVTGMLRRCKNISKRLRPARALRSVARVTSVGVIPSARARGIGRTLMAAFEESAIRLGATVAILGVERDNKAAVGLYETLGWVIAETKTTAYGSVGLVMTKQIAGTLSRLKNASVASSGA